MIHFAKNDLDVACQTKSVLYTDKIHLVDCELCKVLIENEMIAYKFKKSSDNVKVIKIGK